MTYCTSCHLANEEDRDVDEFGRCDTCTLICEGCDTTVEYLETDTMCSDCATYCEECGDASDSLDEYDHCPECSCTCNECGATVQYYEDAENERCECCTYRCECCGCVVDETVYNGYGDCCAEYCTECENYYRSDDGCPNCEACYSPLECYSHRPSWTYYRATSETANGKAIYVGAELELECSHGTHASGILPAGWFAKSDGSLDNGAEFVSHPRTLAAWLDHYSHVRSTLKRLTSEGFHRDYSTGLHFHVSRRAVGGPLNYAKLWRLVSQVARRLPTGREEHEDGISEYARDHTRATRLASVAHPRFSDRYGLLNRTSYTYEFRLWGATTNVGEFYARLAFAFLAPAYVRETSFQDVSLDGFLRWASNRPSGVPASALALLQPLTDHATHCLAESA